MSVLGDAKLSLLPFSNKFLGDLPTENSNRLLIITVGMVHCWRGCETASGGHTGWRAQMDPLLNDVVWVPCFKGNQCIKCTITINFLHIAQANVSVKILLPMSSQRSAISPKFCHQSCLSTAQCVGACPTWWHELWTAIKAARVELYAQFPFRHASVGSYNSPCVWVTTPLFCKSMDSP